MITLRGKDISPLALLVALLLLCWALLLVQFNAAWYGHHNANGAWIGAAVRNFERYGAETFGYLPVITTGTIFFAEDGQPRNAAYYVNHPPLVVWLAAVTAQLGGFDSAGFPREMGIRLSAIFPTMIGFAAFFVMARRLIGNQLAPLALALFALTPMMLYFGRMPNHEPLALMFMLLFAAVSVNWLRRFTWARTGILLLLAALAIWTAWAALLIIAVWCVLVLWIGSSRQRVAALLIGAGAVLAALAVPLFYEMQHAGSIDALLNAFLYRASNRSLGVESTDFTWLEFAGRFFSHILPTMTFSVVVLGMIGLLVMLRQRQWHPALLAWFFVLGGLVFVLVFRNASHYHDYYKIYLLPGLALSAAITIQAGMDLPREGVRKYARPLIVSLLLWSVVGGVYWWIVLHRSLDEPFPRALAADLMANTDTDALVLLDEMRPYQSADYHSGRNLIWGVLNPAAAAEISAAYPGPVYYVICGVVPPEFSEQSGVETAGRCQLFTMRGALSGE